MQYLILQAQNLCLDFFFDLSFQGINRIYRIVLSFENMMIEKHT